MHIDPEVTAVFVSFLLIKLEKEAALLIGLKEDVDEMKSELSCIRPILKAVEGSTEELDLRLKVWIEDVKEVAYDIEDVLDDCTHPRNIVFHLAKRPIWAHRIHRIKKRLHGIKDRRDRYASSWLDCLHRAGVRSCDPQNTSLDIKRDEIVGIEDGMKKLTEFLKVGYEVKLMLISVVGMTGSGKTTLVKQVYDSEEVKEWFQAKAWVRVSRRCDVDELLRSIIQEFPTSSGEAIAPETLKSMSSTQLRDKIKGLLDRMRYVIVLDDIWDIEVLRYIKNALPCRGVGSRIMVTTHMLNVKAYGDVYEVIPLRPEQAWELFYKAISSDLVGKFIPPDLDKLAWELILNKCEGLPLLIVEAGSLVKGKEIDEWNKALGSLVPPELPSDLNLSRPMRRLAISYNRLNSNLRSCFMHFGMFPEGQFIKRMILIRLWIVEGFVEEKPRMTLEDVADSYLDELVNHGVIQVAQRSDYGRVKSYKVHPFMREFILLKSREQNFCVFSTRTNVASTGKIRRLSIHGEDQTNDLHKVSDLPSVRTFIAFMVDPSVLKIFKFKYLRVLHLANSPIETLPESLTELIYLRYLSLENTALKVIPKKLSGLVKLEVLNLKGTFVRELPSQILHLTQMRDLLVYKYIWYASDFNSMEATKLPVGIGLLTSLQKLSLIEVNGNSDLIRELGKLTKLRRLGLVGLRSQDGSEMCESIVKMKYLRSFSVKASTAEEPLNLDGIITATALPDLKRLYLRGCLRKLPEWILSHQFLARLTLGWSHLEDDPFDILHQLPRLAELTLLEAYTGPVMYCRHSGKGEGFPNLKSLHLDGLHHLQTFDVMNGAMPALQKMYIINCEHLRILPLCIRHLTALEELKLSNMPKEFVNDVKMKKQIGCIVMHIGSIHVCDAGDNVGTFI